MGVITSAPIDDKRSARRQARLAVCELVMDALNSMEFGDKETERDMADFIAEMNRIVDEQQLIADSLR